MELSDQEFVLFRDYIWRKSGILVKDNKKYLIQQRLETVAIAHKCSSFSQLYSIAKYRESKQLQDEIINAITTNETSFFRDAHPFSAFKSHILPKIGESFRDRSSWKFDKNKIRIWCAGASAGQEPYSIAILIKELTDSVLRPHLTQNDFDILATDISSSILSKAKSGIYNEAEIQRGLVKAHIDKYFKQEGRQWRINDQIRSMVNFCQLNLAESFKYLGSFNIIFCRNVLIYFNEESKAKIINQFFEVLQDDGYLILGTTENLYGISTKFTSERYNETTIYRKCR